MAKPLQRKPILTAQALDGLVNAKQQILDAVAGRVPEHLVLATAEAAVRLARREATLTEVLPERVVALVRHSLRALAQQKWKPDTALVLHQRRKEGGHGLTQ